MSETILATPERAEVLLNEKSKLIAEAIAAGIKAKEDLPRQIDWLYRKVVEARADLVEHQRRSGAPLTTPDAKQRAIDISNLRFYAAMAHDFKWQTDIIHHGVISQTLSEIAERLATVRA